MYGLDYDFYDEIMRRWYGWRVRGNLGIIVYIQDSEDQHGLLDVKAAFLNFGFLRFFKKKKIF